MAKSCTIEDCTGKHWARDRCRKHYREQWASGELQPKQKLTIQERFWMKVNKDGPVPAMRPDLGPCWMWTVSTFHDGYGQFGIDRIMKRAHRISYVWAKGEIPDGLIVEHLCHTVDETCVGGDSCPHRRCVNPAHLEAITQHENVLRGVRSKKTHCPQMHEYTEENTRIYNGARSCMECDRERSRERYRAKKAQALAS